MKISERERSFSSLCGRVAACLLCERMATSQRILNRSVGSLYARLMFIGEAPGRLGADDTGIPFHGDKSGHNFEALLAATGINRSDVFVTNAVLCNPKDSAGNNSTPSSSEIVNCSSFLREQIDIVKPSIVVTLGTTSLTACGALEPHKLQLAKHVRTAHQWYGRLLIPAYHPGQRAMIHRSFANQRSDYQFIKEQFTRLTKPVVSKGGRTRADVGRIVAYMLERIGRVSYFGLHKLFYLVEYNAWKEQGDRLSAAYIVRQKDGPYCTDLNIKKLKTTFPELLIRTVNGGLYLEWRQQVDLFDSLEQSAEEVLSQDQRAIIDATLNRYGKESNASLKRIVYLSRPMRKVLSKEKELHQDLYNSPIEFLD
jgi:uracil-DNA glycosylase family 4